MSGKRRILKSALLGGVVVGILLISLLLLLDFQVPELGAAALQQIGARVGLQIQAQEIRLNLLRGLELEGITAQGRTEAGKLDLQARRLTVRHRLLPLLQGRLVAHSIQLLEPEILLTRKDRRDRQSSESRERQRKARQKKDRAPRDGRGDAGTQVAGSAASPLELEIEIEHFQVINGELRVISPLNEVQTAHILGLQLSLEDLSMAPGDPRPILGATASGRIEADEVVVDSTRCIDVAGRLELDLGKIRVFDLGCKHDWGDSRIKQLVIDLEPQPFEYDLELEGRSLDTGLLVGAGQASKMGISTLSLAGSGVGPGRDRFRGSGTLSIGAGRLPGLAMLEDIDRILGDGKLVGVGFEPAEVHFQIDPESIRLAPFEIAVQDLRLQIAGSMDRNGVLDLSAAISAPRDRMELRNLPDEVLDRLADDQGRVSISFQIRGTRDRPRVIPDLPELTRDELDRLEEHLKSKLKEALDELLRSRDEG